MPRYTEKELQDAISSVQAGGSVKAAARIHGVPTQTLRDRLKRTQPHRQAHEGQQRLSNVQEQEMVQFVLRQEALGYAPRTASFVL